MYKPLADSTLHSKTKKELIELLRTAEHNAKVSQEWVAQQAENIKDWAPVVRCKDCKHRGGVQVLCNGINIDYCKVWDCTLRNLETTFCSYGEYQTNGGANHEAD